MKTNKLISKIILSACGLAMISPLFIAGPSQQAISEKEHLVSSLYRKISSVENKEGENKDAIKEDKALTLCENKQKIEDLDNEITKLEKEKEKVGKIIAKLEDEDKEDKENKAPTTFSNDVLSQLLFQQIYLNRLLSQSLMSAQTQQRQGQYFGDARWISGSNFGNMSSTQLSNYASMALYNQLAVGVQGNQMWSPQFNQDGSLSNSYYDVDRSNPYSNNFNFGNSNRGPGSTAF